MRDGADPGTGRVRGVAALAPVEVIERRRRGEPLDAESITAFMRAWLDGIADDAQMAAWCMAAALEPPRLEEVDALARVLLASGDRLDLSSFGPTGDCQSTGAVGDTAPLVALPLAAALGVTVAAVAAPGVGYAGGLLDKVASIPGIVTQPAMEGFVRQLRQVGCAVVGPGPRLVGAARRFDALRDSTATGSGVAPTVAALMARALASGAGTLALAVPVGRGGAIAGGDDAERAIDLATRIAEPWGRTVRGRVVDADGPLGRCVGTALEVREAGEVLGGDGPADTRDAAVALVADLVEAAGVVPAGEGEQRALAALASGEALASAERWVAGQGGDPAVWTDPACLPTARVTRPVIAEHDGRVSDIDPRALGEAARWAGAGRLHAAQVIDPAAGVEVLVRAGADVSEGEPILMVSASDAWLGDRAHALAAAGVTVTDPADGDAHA